MGTKRQQESWKSKGELAISGTVKEYKGTLVDDILNLQKDYYSKYSKKYKEKADQKTDIRKPFDKKIKDAMKRKATFSEK